MCNRRRARMSIVIIVVLCFITNLPRFFINVPTSDVTRRHGHKSYTVTEFAKSRGRKEYEFWLKCFFFVFTPWVVVFVTNVIIIRRVTKVNKRMSIIKSDKAVARTKKFESQMTRLLLIVTFTFLVFLAPQCLIKCIYRVDPHLVCSTSLIVRESLNINLIPDNWILKNLKRYYKIKLIHLHWLVAECRQFPASMCQINGVPSLWSLKTCNQNKKGSPFFHNDRIFGRSALE